MTVRWHQWSWLLTAGLVPAVELSPGAQNWIVGKRGEGLQWLGSGQDPRRFGVPPHLFRDCVAKTLSWISPESARLIRPVLAHSGFKTAERHCIHARTIDAGRDDAALIQRLKGDRS